MSNGISLAEETEQRLRWENKRLRELLDQQTQAAANWRASFHESQKYLAMVAPKLNEIAEDSNLQRWNAS